MSATGGRGTHVTPTQAAVYDSFMRTHSMSETARELGICQIRTRETLVQYERNTLRDAGVRPPSLKAMLKGDVTTRFSVSRDLRQGRPAKHPRAVDIPLAANPGGGGWRERPTQPRVIGAPRSGALRLLVSGAEPGAPVHRPFLRNLQAYARHLAAEIVVLHGAGPGRAPLAAELAPFAECRAVEIAGRLDLRPDVPLPRVARAPLEGVERASPRRWAAFVHPVFQLESLPRLASEPPRIHLTTGTVTAAAGLGHGYIRPGALVVEVSADGAVHVRHVSADPDDGSFHDLDVHVSGEVVATGVPVEAVILGDIHHVRIDPAVARATWGEQGSAARSLVDRLRPRVQVVHDVCDFRARSHHDRRDHHVRFVRHVTGTEGVREEMAGAAAFLAGIRRPWGRVAVVHSNHDAALLRWLREADHRTDLVNAEILIDRERALLARLRAGVGSDTFFAETMRGLHADGLDGVRFLADGESLPLAGIECGLHGHAGADGAHGARWRFERLGIDLVLGHSHRPTARGGVYTTGVCQLDMGYNRGPTSWAIAHVAIHADGARQHLIMDGERFTA